MVKVGQDTLKALAAKREEISKRKTELGWQSTYDILTRRQANRSEAAEEFQTARGRATLTKELIQEYGAQTTLGEVVQKMEAKLAEVHQTQAEVVTPEMQQLQAAIHTISEMKEQAGVNGKRPVFLSDLALDTQAESLDHSAKLVTERFNGNITLNKIIEDLESSLDDAQRQQSEQVTPEIQQLREKLNRVRAMAAEYKNVVGDKVSLNEHSEEMNLVRNETQENLSKANLAEIEAHKAVEQIKNQIGDLYKSEKSLSYAATMQRKNPQRRQDVAFRFKR